MKIGVVFAGGASKGAYEIGCLRAIEDKFGFDSIQCVSSASIGTLVTRAFGSRRLDRLIEEWKKLDVEEHGRFFLSYSGNPKILNLICDTLHSEEKFPFEQYVSIWNFTQRRVEYVPFHELSSEQFPLYMKGAIAIPIFSNGSVIDGDRILDGAFLDNIPIYPLIDKDLDYIFCIYFDNYKYIFENPEFDKKVIKLFDFPNEKRLEILFYKPESFDAMVQYGYDYTCQTIEEIFRTDDPADILTRIEARENSYEAVYKPRLTADIVLNSINVMTKRYSKRIESRTKKKK